MAGSVNKVVLLGHLGADPDIKHFANGGKVANLRLATTDSWKDRQTGEKRERTEWHSVSVQSDGLVGIVEKYTRKGSKIYLEGQLRTRKWQDQSGADRYTTEVVVSGFVGSIVLLDGPERRGGSGGSGQTGTGAGGAASRDAGGWNQGGGADDFDDDVPF